MRGARPDAGRSERSSGMGANDTVVVRAPNGRIVRVPRSKLNDALAAGGILDE